MNFSFNLGGNGNSDYRVGKTIQLGPIGSIIMGVIFTIIGVGLIIFMFNLDKDYKEKAKKYVEITAKVVDNNYDISDDVYTPVIEYTVDGQNYRKELSTSSSAKKTEGTEIKIKYNPSNPSEFIESSGSMSFILGIVGGVFSVVGIGLVIFNIGKLGKTAGQVKEFTEQLYDNDVDRLYGQPAEINSTITHNETPANINNNNSDNI